MWRQTDDRKVWYEWIVEVFALSDDPVPTSTSASGQEKAKERARDRAGGDGRRTTRTGTGTRTKKTRIATSELHSSVKEACLM
jgi:type II protein arginine methyltransferase